MDAAAALEAGLAPYRERHPARWSAADALHLTLLFLGSIDPVHVPRLAAIARDVASRARPFEIVTAAGSGAVRGGDGVAWLSLASGGREVGILADALAERLPAGVLAGGRAPRRAPAAHLTVARSASQALIDDLGAERLGPARTTWAADRIVLLRSHLGPERARYVTLGVARLGEPG